jgi:hypothetical protein
MPEARGVAFFRDLEEAGQFALLVLQGQERFYLGPEAFELLNDGIFSIVGKRPEIGFGKLPFEVLPARAELDKVKETSPSRPAYRPSLLIYPPDLFSLRTFLK